MMDSTPQSSKRLATECTSWPVSLLQPSMATLPSLASRPTITWPPKALQASCRKPGDRKSTRLNSSHLVISYAVFCLKKKNSIDHSQGLQTLARCGRTDLARYDESLGSLTF